MNPTGRKGRSSYHHGDLRAALLGAAAEELEDNGIEAFSLRGVAKRAGVSHAAPAHHFRDVKGLLTALAAEGFRKFIDGQRLRQETAGKAPRAHLTAAGLAYIDFARANPALFRLMFASDRPDFDDPELHAAASAGFADLIEDVAALRGADPLADPRAMKDVLASWAIVHGLADLMISGRLDEILDLPPDQLDGFLSEIIERSAP